MPNPDLTLYHLSSCPFCLRVRDVADRLGVELNLVEISQNPKARAHLVSQFGRGTVPVLGVNRGSGQQLLPESDAIIAYLTELVNVRFAA